MGMMNCCQMNNAFFFIHFFCSPSVHLFYENLQFLSKKPPHTASQSSERKNHPLAYIHFQSFYFSQHSKAATYHKFFSLNLMDPQRGQLSHKHLLPKLLGTQDNSPLTQQVFLPLELQQAHVQTLHGLRKEQRYPPA